MISKIYTKTHDEWLALRHKYIGGSDAAAIMGLNPYTSRFALWAEKTNRVPPFEGNLATDVGTYLEEFVAKRFEKETGKKVRRDKASILNDRYPFAIANVDRVIVGEDAGLEIKSVSSLSLSQFKNGEYPARFYAQCVHYLALTCKKRWHLAILVGNSDFKIFTIERDEAEIAELMRMEKAFYEDHILADVPPIVDGSESTSDALPTVYADARDEERDLSDIEEDIEYLLDIKLQIKNLEVLKANLENKIKAEMKESTLATTSSGVRITWSPQSRCTFDRAAFERHFSNIDLTPFYKKSSTRTFKITRKD